MTDQDLIANLIRRNATMRTLARDVIQAHESNRGDKLDESVFALKEYLKAPITKPGENERFIRVWRFEDAPVEYQTLFDSSQEWIWLVYIPALLAGIQDGAEWFISAEFQAEGRATFESGDTVIVLDYHRNG